MAKPINVKNKFLHSFVPWNSRIGLGAKFVFLTVSILGITLGISTLSSINSQNKLIKKHLIDKGELLGHFASRVSAEAILALDFESLSRYMRDVTHQSDMVYAFVIGTNGKPMTSYVDRNSQPVHQVTKNQQVNSPATLVSLMMQLDNIIHMKFPIVYDNILLGKIVVGISKERIYMQERSQLLQLLFRNSLIVIFISICIYLVFRHNTLRPIERLIKGYKRVAEGNLNTPVDLISYDELGRLSNAFNLMMVHLAVAKQENDDLNKNLEQRVAQRSLELSRNETQTRAILDNIGEAIITINELGFIKSINPSGERIFGFSQKEAVGIHSTLLLGENETIHALLDSETNIYHDYRDSPLAANKYDGTSELTGKRKDGTTFPMEVLVTKLLVNEEKMRICIIRDITIRKEVETELVKHREHLEKLVENRTTELAVARDQANKANHTKSQFLANMSHEIRTPLTAIIGFSENLLDKDISANDRQDAINTIIQSGNHLMQLINNILDLSKVEAGKLELESIEFSPFEMLEEIKALVINQTTRKKLGFNINYQFPFPSKIKGDPIRTKQIILNLCSNAIKFTYKGQIDIYARYDKTTNLLNFEISDTGIGMTNVQTKKIFSPFTQADSTTTKRYGGTGLGLSLSKRLAENLGGTLSVKSEFGKGSRFIASISAGNVAGLKYVNKESEFLPTLQKPSSSQKFVPISGNILLVEDMPNNQKLISWQIKKLGAKVKIVNNGKEAVELATAENFDLILMDIQMPIMDGLQATSLLRERGYDGPIVALTANAMQKDKNLCYEAGCNNFVPKPIDKIHFYEVLSTYLEKQSEDNNLDPIVSKLTNEDHEYQKLVQSFIGNLSTLLESLTHANTNQDWETVKAISHNLKGLGGGMGFPIITAVAKKIEIELSAEDYSSVENLISDLNGISKRIRAA